MSKCKVCSNKILLNNIWICKHYNKKINFKEKVICPKFKIK